MKRFEMLSIDELVSDVAVDPIHTKELADSIMSRGQLAPAIIREETLEVIDGFHRIAAMKELGCKQVECVLTPTDDEEFWDFRIIQASLHKNVTFARAIDWIDQVFALSPWTNRYKNARGLFHQARQGVAPKEVVIWAEKKAKTWGLAVRTIENWLDAKEVMEPSLLEEVKKGLGTQAAPTSTYIEVAQRLPTRPDLHRTLIEKATREDLSQKEVRELSKALKQAEDEEEVQTILKEPMSRTAEELTRTAKVERLISHPPVPEAREAIHRVEMAANVVELKLEWERVATMAEEADLILLDSLTDEQKGALIQSGEKCIQASQKLLNYLKRKLGRMIELPGKEV